MSITTFTIPAQNRLKSAPNANSTAEAILSDTNLAGKVAIVTGGSSGLGLETARVLSNAGATVVVPARATERAVKALASLSNVEVHYMDLEVPESVDAFAAGFLASLRPLHMLINCAGVMATPLVRDARGYEGQLVANHLGHFQLTVQLWPALVRAAGARVVAYSSRGHRISPFDFADPNFMTRKYNPWVAYGQSKTANALFALGLDSHGASINIRAFSVHPGTVLTDLARHLSDEEMKTFGVNRETPHGSLPEGKSFAEGGDYKTLEQGAATGVWCATSAALDGLGGLYCENLNIADAVPSDSPAPEGVRPWACDPQLAQDLWNLSENLTGVRLAK